MQSDNAKLSFLNNVVSKSLDHLKTTPNVPTPKGGMSHDKMLSFLQQITKHGLQHFDQGGTTLSGPSVAAGPASTTTNGFLPSLNDPGKSAESLVNPLNYFNGKNEAIGMADIRSLLGGTQNQFQATAAPIQAGTNVNQLNQAYNGAQTALGTQGAVTDTLNAGLTQGAGNQAQLANMYLNQANGQGPNPALAQLNQATGQNIAQQAALAAGQRGGGANAGLIARQNAQQGAATQQNAVGQAATMTAQQQLAAEQNLQNLSANQIAQGTTATQGLNNANQNEQSILQGANNAFNNANVSQQSNLNNVNSQVSEANQSASNKGIGGLLGGIASAFFEKGGTVERPEEMPWVVNHRKMMSDGGITGEATSAPQSYVGNWLNSNVQTSGGPEIGSANPYQDNSGPNPLDKAGEQIGGDLKKRPKGDPSMLDDNDLNSLGSGVEEAGGAGDLVDGSMAFAARGGLMENGGKVAAKGSNQKAVVKGDSFKNDKVPAMLSQGELVIDRDTMADPGPMGQMARALQKHIQSKNKKGGKK